MRSFFLTIGLGTLTIFAGAAYSDSGYHVLRKIPISGNGNWDYVRADSVNRRLYVSHGNAVEVLNLDTGEIVGQIIAPKGEKPDTPMQTHGAVPAPDLGLGFTSDGGAISSTIFDLKTLKPLVQVKLKGSPDGFVYDPFTHLVFMFSEETKDGTAIDGIKRMAVGTIPLGGKPEEAVSDGKGHLYIDIQDKDLVDKIDVKTLAVTEKWPVGPLCHEPASLAIDAPHQRLFVGCRNQVMIIVNANNGHVITKLPIGEVTDAMEYDPQRNLAFSSNIDGTLTVVHENSPNEYSVVDNVKTEFGARTMALDLKTHRLFLILADRTNIPAPGTASQHLRPVIVPNSFHVLVVGKE